MNPKGSVTHVARRVALFGVSVALVSSIVAVGGTALASSRPSVQKPATLFGPRAVPKVDIVGKGQFNCSTVTGEVGYSPAIISGGRQKERVSIWFIATGCKPTATTGAQPIPKYVVGAISFQDNNFLNGCPQISGPPLGVGTLDLSYNFPPVPALMIDPSVAPVATVKDVGALWQITGGISDGSYVSPGFTALIKPNPIAPGTCGNGITSEYIIRGTLTAV